MKKLNNQSLSFSRPLKMVALSLLLLIYVTPAFAYLDPGTGSIILQGVIASVAAALAAGGVFWHRVKTFFSSLFSSSESPIVEPDSELQD